MKHITVLYREHHERYKFCEMKMAGIPEGQV